MRMKKLFSTYLLCMSLVVLMGQTQIALVDYMKVPEGGNAAYEAMEKELWKPMHQELVDQGACEGWFLYSIPYPGGTDAEYHYATVRLYSDISQIESPLSNLEELFNKVHPNMDAAEMTEKTLSSRDLVKTYRASNWKSVMSETFDGPSNLIQLVYFHVPMHNWTAYQEMEEKYFLPTHKKEMETGYRYGWAGWMMERPMGMNHPYQFVAVDHYKDWDQYTKQIPQDLYEGVFAGDELKKRDEIFYKTVKMVNLEEWHLIDYVMEMPLGSAGNE